MVVCLSVKTATLERVFSYNGPDPELWVQSIQRILNNLDDHNGRGVSVEFEGNFYNASYSELCRLRDRVRLPNYFIEIEKVVQQVSSGQWTDLDIPRDHFKAAVKAIWNCCKANLTLEAQVFTCLYQEGNGGLKVESILSRLLAAGVVARFGAVRDALGHLCKLYLVERCYGQFSMQEGMLNR